MFDSVFRADTEYEKLTGQLADDCCVGSYSCVLFDNLLKKNPSLKEAPSDFVLTCGILDNFLCLI